MKFLRGWVLAAAVALPVSALSDTYYPTHILGQTAVGAVEMCLDGTGKAVPETSGQCAGSVPVSGTISVSNFPGTQTVSGTVAVSNLPTLQAISSVDLGTAADNVWGGSGSGTLIAVSKYEGSQLSAILSKLNGSVAVTGTFFQATQPVSISSMPTTPVTGTFWQTTQPVSGTFWQSTQPVSIASMPTTPVTGTFWQSIQPISSVDLGTAADGVWGGSGSGSLIAISKFSGSELASILSKLNSSIAVTGSFWQTTQPISASSLPLPSGASTSANQTTEITDLVTIGTNSLAASAALGTPADAAWSGSGSGTLDAILKKMDADIAAALSNTSPVNTRGDVQDVSGGASSWSLQMGAIYAPTLGTLSAGAKYPLSIDSAGNLLVDMVLPTALPVSCGGVTCASAGNQTNTQFSPTGGATAPTKAMGVGGIYLSSPTGLTNSQAQAFLLDSNGDLKISIAGNTGGVATQATLSTILANLGSPMQATGGTVGLVAGTALVGKFGIDQTTLGSTNGMTPVPAPSGGLLLKSVIIANNTTSISICSAACQYMGVIAFNNGSVIGYGKLYNALQANVTCGIGTPIDRFMDPAPGTGGGQVNGIPSTYGVAMSTGLTLCFTGGFGDGDTTAPAASTYFVTVYYKQ